jgi:hypothetical protein
VTPPKSPEADRSTQLPDPFAAVHIFRPNAPYAPPVVSFASPIARASLNPYWAADFEFEAEEGTRCVSRRCRRAKSELTWSLQDPGEDSR